VFSYIIRRITYMIPTLFLISVIAFLVIQAPPGDFLSSQMQNLQQQFGERALEQIEALRIRYGLDKPLYVQYFRWISRVLQGDFGVSFVQNRPVKDIIRERLPPTILISVLTVLFTWIVAIPIGVLSAVKQNTWADYLFTFIGFIGISIPNFLMALVLMAVLYDKFGMSVGGLFSPEFRTAPWSLARFYDLLKHLILPIVVVGTSGTASVIRVLRGTMLDELGKDYVKVARSKGISEWRLVWFHPFKVAILPMVSTIGWVLPSVVSGETISSIVLNLPTTGEAMYSALLHQDMYVAGAFVLFLSSLTVVGTLISDILLVFIDPRIRYE
jgi:peptide/nickel transport system permease protein